VLQDYRTVWDRKPVLRLVYDDFYDRIVAACVSGKTIEVGGGIGNLKERFEQRSCDRYSVRIVARLRCRCPESAVRDRYSGKHSDGRRSHHIEFPTVFFREAERVLRRDGRLIMMEPAISWVSTLFYRLLHQEPVRTSGDPFIEGAPDPHRDPYDSNQAVPTLLATRDRERFHRLFPNVKVSHVAWFSLIVYSLSGGFKSWNLIPGMLASPMQRLE
jgi:hypothetical protein